MVDADSARTAKAVQQRTGRTFHLATRLLPERIRHPTYVLYAFFRVADEVVDRADDTPASVRRDRLDQIRAAVLDDAATDDPVVAAFRTLCADHDVDDEEVAVFLDAMESDVDRARYDTFADLREYMRGSAVAVGNMMMTVMDVPDPESARPHAAALAEAFQLTNFLRDVREDVRDYGRVYLPQETLAEHGVTEADLADATVTDGFRDAMADELSRAERLYREGVAGIRYLPADCRFAVLLSATLYAEHHRLIRDRDYDVLTATPELSRTRRLRVLARTWWHWRRRPDPEAAFYAASPVPERSSGTEPPVGVPDSGHPI
ncbi:phytoene/squalene synthase family protein [Halomicrobium salinisoli]|uniref:phytoene/squalene synthase family protein n=1 Tax=Halomicrobium salinisoli TaxID=2878391 RepID=UPI001CEFFB59|nr:phytoene/squalene synthase family protein [Halomicrobium salinisoli]